MKLEDQITFSHTPTRPGTTAQSPGPSTLTLLFVTGNPGLIEYYRPFLTLVFGSLRAAHPTENIRVRGSSLLGFGVRRAAPDAGGPYDLDDQVGHVGRSLDACVRGAEGEGEGEGEGGGEHKVVLVGHSVGAYILLEVLRRWKKREGGRGPVAAVAAKARVVGGVCLFPTVTHIARSPSGRRISPLCDIPYFAVAVGLFARALLSWLPSAVLNAVVTAATGFPDHAAETTTAFLQSPQGVRQALYLAGHEMKTITTDEWDDELWGVAGTTEAPAADKTNLYFYFGTGDHWVADETRDELIAARASTGKVGADDDGRPVMEIDDCGTPHGFCMKHNALVARKVVEYVEDIMNKTA